VAKVLPEFVALQRVPALGYGNGKNCLLVSAMVLHAGKLRMTVYRAG
jgi:hypothetical protein